MSMRLAILPGRFARSFLSFFFFYFFFFIFHFSFFFFFFFVYLLSLFFILDLLFSPSF